MNSAFSRPSTRPVLGIGQSARLALVYLTLALYGSLVPFRVRPLLLSEAVDRFLWLPWLGPWNVSRTDWAANILLFIPLSYLLMMTLCVDRRRGTGLRAAPLVVSGCGLLSAAVEFAQLYLPDRGSAPNDVAAETLGATLGALLWLARGPQITAWARRVATATRPGGQAARLLPAYLVFLALIHAMPLDLTLSPAEVYHKYREGRIRLVPFADSQGLLDLVEAQAWNFVYFAPVGLLLARWPGRAGRGAVLAVASAAGTAGLMEALQLFVYSRSADATDAVVGALAVLIGWGTGRVLIRPSPRRGDEPRGDFPGPLQPSDRAALLLSWAFLLAVVQWQPFNFVTDPAWLSGRLPRVVQVPFADYYWATEYQAFDQVLHKVLLFLPIGALLAPAGMTPGRRGARAVALLVALALAAGLEAGQLFLPGRFPSVGDVLIEIWGANLGFLMARKLQDVRAAVPDHAPGHERHGRPRDGAISPRPDRDVFILNPDSVNILG